MSEYLVNGNYVDKHMFKIYLRVSLGEKIASEKYHIVINFVDAIDNLGLI